MAFKKGKSGNPTGKPKGATNKTTRELREMITDFLEKNFSKIESDFDKLAPKERAKLFCDLLQYGVPKLQNVNLQTSEPIIKPLIIDWSSEDDNIPSKTGETEL